jgi:hypothetical protein
MDQVIKLMPSSVTPDDTTDPDNMWEKSFEFEVPDFELIVATIGLGNGTSRITTRAIDIQCTIESAPLLKELFSRSDFTTNTQRTGRFISRGLAQMASPTVYKKFISLHNQFLTNVTQVPILGLSLEATHYRVLIQDPTTGKQNTSNQRYH